MYFGYLLWSFGVAELTLHSFLLDFYGLFSFTNINLILRIAANSYKMQVQHLESTPDLVCA